MTSFLISDSTKPYPWRLKVLYQDAQKALSQQEWAKASSLLFYIHEHAPDFHHALFQLAVAQMSLENWKGAEEHFEKLRQYAPWDADIICNLGITYWKQKKLKKALSYFRFNLKHHPHHLDTPINLASLYVEYHHLPQAIQQYTQILYRQPKRHDIRFNLAACLQKQGWLEDAIFHYRMILQDYPAHFDCLYNLACLYWQQQKTDAARFYLKAAQKIKNPPHLQFMMDTMIDKKADFSHHHDYVKNLFEHYALDYEKHLSRILKYRLPDFLNTYLKEKNFQHVVEIGCGTGLCGVAIKKASKHLIGIDISPQMLIKAELKNAYDSLLCQDALAFLKQYTRPIDCLLALDVSPYMPNFLEILQFENIKDMIFTIEISSTYPQSLETSGRIAFHPQIIEEKAQRHQYQIIHQEKLEARLQHQLFCDLMFFHLKR